MRPLPFTRSPFCTLGHLLCLGQRTFARVAYDQTEPEELSGDERAKARRLFGDVERVPPEARRVTVQLKGRDVGGTRLGAEYLARLGATAPIRRAGPSELVYVFFGGPKLRHGRPGLGFSRNALLAADCTIIDDSKDGFTLVRHDRRHVRFEIFAASKGGDNTRGVPVLGALLTEAGFYFDESTGVANGEAIFGGIIPRLLPGGMIIIESTPWAESGLLHREFSANWGAPRTALAALCPTLEMRDDDETRAMVAAEYQRDTENADRELGAAFMPVGAGHYFDGFAVASCPDPELPLEIPREDIPRFGKPEWRIAAGFDPAYVRDAAEGVIVRSRHGVVQVVDVFTRVPKKGEPLVPSVVDREFAQLVKKHGGRFVATDIHYRESVREHLQGEKIRLLAAPGGNAGKVSVFAATRDVMHGGRLRWSEGHRRLTRQIREVISKPLSGGLVAISSPRRRGDHGDAAHALCLAVWAATLQGRASDSPPDLMGGFSRPSERSGFASRDPGRGRKRMVRWSRDPVTGAMKREVKID